MNFARAQTLEETKRKSGSVWRNAWATTISEGGMPGRMVRSQDPNESHTSLGTTTARYWTKARIETRVPRARARAAGRPHIDANAVGAEFRHEQSRRTP